MINVLSLFNGISVGNPSLKRAGVKVGFYYSSEIDKNAMQVELKNYPSNIQLGNVSNWKEWDIDWSSIDLLIGGSPCQGFSFSGKQLAFEDPRSKLFFVYVDILNHIKKSNPNVKFLLENVVMKKQFSDVITEYMGVEPILINSALQSAQSRKRLYWTNISDDIKQPEDKHIAVDDILQPEEEVDEKYYIKNIKSMNWVNRINNKNNAPIRLINIGNGGQGERVYYTNAKSSTLCALGDGRGAKTGLYLVAQRGRYLVDGKRADYFGAPTIQQLETRVDNKTNTLTTVQKDNYVLIEIDNEYYRIRKLTPIECFTGDTFIMGSNKFIKDIEIGDEVLSRGGMQKVLHKFENYIEDFLYNVKVQGALPIKATANHPVLVCKKISPKNRKVVLSEPYWEKVENLVEKEHYMLYPKIKGRIDIKEIDLEGYVRVYNNNLKQRATKGLPKRIEISEDFCWLMGICVAEASMNLESTEISLGRHEKGIIIRCQEILLSIGIKSSTHTQDNCTKINCSSAVFSRMLKEHIGVGALNKKIPDWILYNTNTVYVEKFLEGYFEGDGCERITRSGSQQKEGVTVSINLAHNIQVALLRLGIFSSIYKSIPKSGLIMGRECNVKDKYIMSYITNNKYHVRYKQLEDYIAVPIQKIKKELFKGFTYNIETEDNTYLASNLVVHNCERLQTLEDNFTLGITDGQRIKALGNSWTCDIIAHILSYLKIEGDKK